MALTIGSGITFGSGIVLNPPLLPNAPTIGTATATGSTTATVTFTAPANNGSPTILSYTATSSPGGITGTLTQAGSGTITVSGLSGSTSYTFTVTATNTNGSSVASSASNSITTSSGTIPVELLLVAGGGGGGGYLGGAGGAGGLLYYGSNTTPKTDVILGNKKISVKAGNSQLMSGGKNESLATFYAAAKKVPGILKTKEAQEVIKTFEKFVEGGYTKSGTVEKELGSGKNKVLSAGDKAHKEMKTKLQDLFNKSPKFKIAFLKADTTNPPAPLWRSFSC